MAHCNCPDQGEITAYLRHFILQKKIWFFVQISLQVQYIFLNALFNVPAVSERFNVFGHAACNGIERDQLLFTFPRLKVRIILKMNLP